MSTTGYRDFSTLMLLPKSKRGRRRMTGVWSVHEEHCGILSSVLPQIWDKIFRLETFPVSYLRHACFSHGQRNARLNCLLLGLWSVKLVKLLRRSSFAKLVPLTVTTRTLSAQLQSCFFAYNPHLSSLRLHMCVSFPALSSFTKD